jgi:DNA-binding LacI/PurR family transcriptional regulator
VSRGFLKPKAASCGLPRIIRRFRLQHRDPTQPARSAYDITNWFLDLDDHPTAIFAANDESAIGAMAAIRIAD